MDDIELTWVPCHELNKPTLTQTFVGIMIRLMPLGDFFMLAVSAFLAYAQGRETKQEHSPDKALAGREAMHRFLLTGGLKTWAAVNVESLRLWDGIIYCLIVELVRYGFECTVLRADQWKNGVWRVLLCNAVPMAVMMQYRGVLKESHMNALGKWFDGMNYVVVAIGFLTFLLSKYMSRSHECAAKDAQETVDEKSTSLA